MRSWREPRAPLERRTGVEPVLVQAQIASHRGCRTGERRRNWLRRLAKRGLFWSRVGTRRREREDVDVAGRALNNAEQIQRGTAKNNDGVFVAVGRE